MPPPRGSGVITNSPTPSRVGALPPFREYLPKASYASAECDPGYVRWHRAGDLPQDRAGPLSFSRKARRESRTHARSGERSNRAAGHGHSPICVPSESVRDRPSEGGVPSNPVSEVADTPKPARGDCTAEFRLPERVVGRRLGCRFRYPRREPLPHDRSGEPRGDWSGRVSTGYPLPANFDAGPVARP